MSELPWRQRTQLIQGPPGPMGSFLAATAAWTPGAVLNGATASTTITVNGAMVTSPAWAAWSASLPAGVILTAQVTVANTVLVTLINLSGSTQTITAGTVTATVPPGSVGVFLNGSSAWSPGTIANNGLATLTVAVTGAVLGQDAWAAFLTALPAGVIVWASVSSAGNVQVCMINLSGVSQTISPSSVNVSVH
jgi:hypothetical protein